MKRQSEIQPDATLDYDTITNEAPLTVPSDTVSKAAAPQSASPAGTGLDATADVGDAPQRQPSKKRSPQISNRGITTQIHPTKLRDIFWLHALTTLNRFRVIRAIDVAVACCPERPFKAALTAAQRCMRSLAKAGFVKRYRTDRFQHVYGLTVAGARWLDDHGVDASSSVRRVADMSNPEHQLWMNFIVLACQARGLRALTESEAMQALNEGRDPKQPVRQGHLTIKTERGNRTLRPDVLGRENDGTTWYEIDRSKRGADREESLWRLCRCVGSKLADGRVLRRVVVFARTDRILARVTSIVRSLAADNKDVFLNFEDGSRRFREIEPGVFEVWAAVLPPGKRHEEDRCVGHVILQMLPVWMPKVRLDAKNRQPLTGWFEENYLPYRRPKEANPWSRPVSPFAEGARKGE